MINSYTFSYGKDKPEATIVAFGEDINEACENANECLIRNGRADLVAFLRENKEVKEGFEFGNGQASQNDLLNTCVS